MNKIKSKKLKKIVAEEYRKIRRQNFIAKIIKEEYSGVRKKLQEDANDDTFEMVDAIVDALGPDRALDNLVQAMERQNAHKLLGYIIQSYDIPFHPEVEIDESWQKDNIKMRGKNPSKGKEKKDPRKDGSWLPEEKLGEGLGPELSHQISMLEDIGEHIAWAIGKVEDPQVATRLEQADNLVTDLFATMHGGIQEETKPHEADRQPSDTPKDRERN